jgi:UDP-N-acetylmuramoylalanine--D-glutamate ligase
MTEAKEPILVLGLGRSGVAAAQLLIRLGETVVGYDRDPERGHEIRGLAARLSGPTLPDLDGFARVIQSPGVPVPSDPRIVPEVELAAEHLSAPLVGVTGTNGKSTTVVLLEEMLRASGLSVATGGNLGTALCELVDVPADRVVAELSSFQLEHARNLRTAVAVLLNLAPDHLDRHGTLEAYGEAKARLAMLAEPDSVLVYNADDPWARGVATRAQATSVPFSTRQRLPTGAFLDGDALVLIEKERTRVRVGLQTLSPAARSPLDYALAALAAACAAGATSDGIASALSRFEALPHRAACVAVRAGVRYVNDSKATNPTAAAWSVESCKGPVVWIAGGRNKGLDLTPLAEAAKRVRFAVVYGEAGGDLENVLEGVCPVVRAQTFDAAFAAAVAGVRSGDTALLSPGCASQDQFRSFEERGERFAELARAVGPDRLEASC